MFRGPFRYLPIGAPHYRSEAENLAARRNSAALVVSETEGEREGASLRMNRIDERWTLPMLRSVATDI